MHTASCKIKGNFVPNYIRIQLIQAFTNTPPEQRAIQLTFSSINSAEHCF